MPKAERKTKTPRKQLAVNKKRQVAEDMKPFPFQKLPNEIQYMILDLALECDRELSESDHLLPSESELQRLGITYLESSTLRPSIANLVWVLHISNYHQPQRQN